MDLQVDPGQMQFLMSTATLPMVAKPVYGIISDSVYIKGAHRVPYLIIAGKILPHYSFKIVIDLDKRDCSLKLMLFLGTMLETSNVAEDFRLNDE